MRVTLERSGERAVETGLRVIFTQAITLPVKLDGQVRGDLVVYVGVAGNAPGVSPNHLSDLAMRIADAIELDDRVQI